LNSAIKVINYYSVNLLRKIVYVRVVNNKLTYYNK